MSPEEFRNVEKLYHYTSLTSGMLILLTNKMIMSSPKKMNDIGESNRLIYTSGCEQEEADAEFKKYYQSSFALDDKKVPGFAIAPMWGHYGEKGNGICLVFDKRKLISLIEKHGYRYGEIRYLEDQDSAIKVEGNPKKFFRENTSEVFFKKSQEWGYEREFRVIARSESAPVEMGIGGCIIAVIVHTFDDIDGGGNTTSSAKYKSLVRSLKSLNIPILIFDTIDCQYQLADYEHDARGCTWYPKPQKYEVDA